MFYVLAKYHAYLTFIENFPSFFFTVIWYSIFLMFFVFHSYFAAFFIYIVTGSFDFSLFSDK